MCGGFCKPAVPVMLLMAKLYSLNANELLLLSSWET